MTESPTSASDTDPDPAEDDVKRKFREALERKQAKAKAGSSHADGGTSTGHAHGPAPHKRNFTRRKSG